jgi:hypothetical protein
LNIGGLRSFNHSLLPFRSPENTIPNHFSDSSMHREYRRPF